MKVTSSAAIKAPQDKVFAMFADIPRIQERIKGITKVELLSDVQSGQGVRWRETRVMFGKEATEEMEITSFDEPSSYVVEAESHGMHYTSRYRFDQQGDDSTKVHMEFEGIPVTFLAKLMIPLGVLFKGATKRALEKDMHDLKEQLEA